MSEDKTKTMSVDSTNPLPFEELVTRQLEALFKRLDQIETNIRAEFAIVRTELAVVREEQVKLREEQTKLREEQTKLREEQDQLRMEMRDRFLQLSSEVRAVDARLLNSRKRSRITMTKWIRSSKSNCASNET
jgi:uncharacterized protein (DUF3084 family)